MTPAFEQCASTILDGSPRRYALLRSETKTRQTVIFDLGGPGLSVLSGLHNLGDAVSQLGAIAEAANVLVIEEPWVTARVDEECRGALRTLGKQVVSATAPGDVAADLAACWGQRTSQGAYGFSPSSYRATVEAIADTEELDVIGFVGASFGSIRAAYLEPTANLQHAAFLNPYPVGVALDEVLRARSDLITEWLDATVGPDGASQLTSDLREGSAILATSYRGQTSLVNHARRRLAGEISDAEVEGLALDIWQIYGEIDVSLSYLAYLTETCPLLRQPVDDHAMGMIGVLGAAHRACRSVPPSDSEPLAFPRSSCVVANPADPVAPLALVRRALGRSPDATADPSLPHAGFGGLEPCLARFTTDS